MTVDKNVKYNESNKGYTTIEPSVAKLSQEQLDISDLVDIRAKREFLLKELDRPLWLNNLSNEQREEVDAYYRALLDATDLKILPEKPSFM